MRCCIQRSKEVNRLKDELFSPRSQHELKTPLTPILGAMYRLRSLRPDDQEVQKAIDMVERNAKRQSALIDDLLDVSRVASGKFDLKHCYAELSNIINRALDVARPAAEAMGIALVVSINDRLKPIWCDPDRIQQALWNLISNAIKFSPPGGHVRVQADSMGTAARIVVEDEGERTRRLPATCFRYVSPGGPVCNLRTISGLGLGLSIVRHIVQQHAGTIRAESGGSGTGSRFVIEIPYRRGESMVEKDEKNNRTRVPSISRNADVNC